MAGPNSGLQNAKLFLPSSSASMQREKETASERAFGGNAGKLTHPKPWIRPGFFELIKYVLISVR
jgi:hypothetical protein